jgi:hypothetical protein
MDKPAHREKVNGKNLLFSSSFWDKRKRSELVAVGGFEPPTKGL